ncbi:MAG TPA: AI-2E family transporter [Candidatus Limnocylindrales bacterium]|nr:AI-2E family transporter [Candidatus Limnocylindrales bacterium]
MTMVTERQRRWLTAVLVLGALTLALVLTGLVASVFFAFGDLVLVFFLAWLLAFILSPVVAGLTRLLPFLPRVGAVVLVYAALVGAIVLAVVVIAGALADSIADFVAGVPNLRQDLPNILRPWQERLNGLGLSQVDLEEQATIFLDNIADYAVQLAGPIQQLAVASLGAMGNLLIVLILSLYMVVDRDAIVSFLFRLVPPAYKEEARLLETSVARSFGGFLRGQAILGVVYAAIAAVTSAVLGIPYTAVTTALAGGLMAIPFFGPFVAWAPPVVVALLATPDATVPSLLLMGIGWLVVMNGIQPRLMQEAVGIHPIVVLGSVLIGSKIAGITGAIFGIPIAAVISAFFFHFLVVSREPSPVATRAAKRVEAREGRPVRVPREPAPGIDPDVSI